LRSSVEVTEARHAGEQPAVPGATTRSARKQRPSHPPSLAAPFRQVVVDHVRAMTSKQMYSIVAAMT
jgi:hypothetical protein